MIQLIGIIIGSYVTTRMVDLLSRPESTTILKVFAVLTFVVTVLCTLFILAWGAVTGEPAQPY